MAKFSVGLILHAKQSGSPTTGKGNGQVKPIAIAFIRRRARTFKAETYETCGRNKFENDSIDHGHGRPIYPEYAAGDMWKRSCLKP